MDEIRWRRWDNGSLATKITEYQWHVWCICTFIYTWSSYQLFGYVIFWLPSDMEEGTTWYASHMFFFGTQSGSHTFIVVEVECFSLINSSLVLIINDQTPSLNEASTPCFWCLAVGKLYLRTTLGDSHADWQLNSLDVDESWLTYWHTPKTVLCFCCFIIYVLVNSWEMLRVGNVSIQS